MNTQRLIKSIISTCRKENLRRCSRWHTYSFGANCGDKFALKLSRRPFWSTDNQSFIYSRKVKQQRPLTNACCALRFEGVKHSRGSTGAGLDITTMVSYYASSATDNNNNTHGALLPRGPVYLLQFTTNTLTQIPPRHTHTIPHTAAKSNCAFSIFPGGGALQGVSAGLQPSSVVSLQVLPPQCSNGHLVEVAELEEELHGRGAAAHHRRVVSNAPVLPQGVCKHQSDDAQEGGREDLASS